VPRRRSDSFAPAERLAALTPRPAGGWVPPPVDDVPRVADDAERSWADRAGDPPESGAWWNALVPSGLRGGRWDPGRRGIGALAAVAVVAAAVSGMLLLRGRPHEQPADVAVATTAPSSAPAGPLVVVDVAGKVRRPGIVRLPFGSRVYDALRLAGGPLPGASTDGLNLARKLADGEQVVVGVPTAAAGGSAGAAGGLLDLNAADLGALDGLPGIGPVLAQKILDWRTEHGRFASVDQLREVGGIGESKYAALKNKVRV
jgi:competence protein ComEA